MLALPIKKKWFDMIKSGEKKEEYREIKPYWTSRFTHNLRKTVFNTYAGHVIFRNGYSKNSPRIKCCVEISKGTGNPEWGAEKRKRVLHIRDIGGVQMISKEEMKEALRVGDDRTVIEYIEQLESDKQKLIDKLKKRILDVEKCYNNLVEPYLDKTINMIYVSLMTKKEREEFINKRNCLLVQKQCYEEILLIVKGESKNEKRENNRIT